MELEKLAVVYNGEAVFMSVVFVYLGAYIAISLCEQLRLSAVQKSRSKLLDDRSILIIMSLSLGGVGIWCMHFVGMSAVSLKTSDGLEIQLKFGIIRTVMSLVAVVVLLYSGLFVAARDVVFRKTKTEIIDMFICQSTQLTFKQIQGIKNGSTIVYLIGTKSLSNLLIGGMLAASGKVTMHYLGMSSILFPGVIKFNYGVIAASVIIAILGSLSAFWTLFRLLSIYPQKEILRVCCALFVTGAKCGMHYVGMQSAEFLYDPTKKEVFVGANISAQRALMAALTASLVFVGILISIIMSDLRGWLYGFAMKLNAADECTRLLLKASSNSVDMPAIVARYAKKREAQDLSDGRTSSFGKESSSSSPRSVIRSENRSLDVSNHSPRHHQLKLVNVSPQPVSPGSRHHNSVAPTKPMVLDSPNYEQHGDGGGGGRQYGLSSVSADNTEVSGSIAPTAGGFSIRTMQLRDLHRNLSLVIPEATGAASGGGEGRLNVSLKTTASAVASSPTAAAATRLMCAREDQDETIRHSEAV